MTPLIWTRRAIEDVQSIRQFIAQDSPHYAELVRQQLIAAVERLPTFPQSGRVVPEANNPAIREVIQGSYRIVYRLIHDEIHILTVHHAARLLKL
ncbi:MAG: type II toxin-antitoxin system RelE/ParE family toxin [Nitrospira sp.]|jgi:toxin ParE1/3/4|nr:MAG: type II toxin-antitoxin system RelE/ParE family toxin [Nitrospira sp.]